MNIENKAQTGSVSKSSWLHVCEFVCVVQPLIELVPTIDMQ